MTILGEPAVAGGVGHHALPPLGGRSSTADNGTRAELLTAAGDGSDVDNGNIQDLLNDTGEFVHTFALLCFWCGVKKENVNQSSMMVDRITNILKSFLVAL
uniref:Uncharacterized protein n=1 Tax=Anopheles farauti TaxID=69004 RepID=A0A182QXC0_9DIPT